MRIRGQAIYSGCIFRGTDRGVGEVGRGRGGEAHSSGGISGGVPAPASPLRSSGGSVALLFVPPPL